MVGKSRFLRLLTMFPPTKSAARNALKDFLPKTGRDYASGRNYDPGPGGESTVSRLSPWIRNRILPEWEVLDAVLSQHSASAASKFIDEVCWRTYWKGWLQMRPSVWQDYLDERTPLLDEYEKNPGYLNAISSRTGIDCFDTWNTGLIESNYLHNHARMWYASIWVHTLKLPWQLGADWFFRHLLDGDPASNTLSWRWVAGLHTKGKAYLARQDNIRKYTNGRFSVDAELATEPIDLDDSEKPKARELTALQPIPTGKRLGLIVTDEDLSATEWLKSKADFVKQVGFLPESIYEQLDIAKSVIRFRKDAISETGLNTLLVNSDGISDWATKHGLDGVVLSEPTTGPTRDALSSLADLLKRNGKHYYTARHWWDETLYPHTTHGFFHFKKAIPKALDRIQQPVLEGIE